MPQPSKSPEPAAATTGRRAARGAANANRATPHAATPAKEPSEDTATRMAVGATATTGAASPAVVSSANAGAPTTTPAAPLDPTSRHNSPAHAPPPKPMRSSQTNVSSAPGGWPDTWVIHEFGWKSGILVAKVRTASGMSVMVGTWRRYSCCAVRRWAKPPFQPSIMASENAHAHAVAQVTHGSARHRRRSATDCPQRTAAMPMTIAGTVPQPTCAFHHPKIGAVSAKLWSRVADAWISGVTVPAKKLRCKCGTTNAAITRSAPTVTATASLRPIRTPASLLRGWPDPSNESVTPHAPCDRVTEGPRWTTTTWQILPTKNC